jgi:hypothetical protein
VAKSLARRFTFGRSRVLTPVRCGFFSEVFPHHHIVVCLISQIRRMLGQYQPLHLPSAPIHIPNLAEKTGKPQPGGVKDVSFPFTLYFFSDSDTTMVLRLYHQQIPTKIASWSHRCPPHKIFHFLFSRLVLLFFLVISVGTKFVFKRASSMR